MVKLKKKRDIKKLRFSRLKPPLLWRSQQYRLYTIFLTSLTHMTSTVLKKEASYKPHLMKPHLKRHSIPGGHWNTFSPTPGFSFKLGPDSGLSLIEKLQASKKLEKTLGLLGPRPDPPLLYNCTVQICTILYQCMFNCILLCCELWIKFHDESPKKRGFFIF